MAIKRKIRKLFRDPKLFFSDMLIKHRKKLDKLKPIKKYDGQNQFTVVSAVYGVEKYLDDYFKSLVNQRLDFKKHIHLIMVDDGSLDNSAEIIKKWQKKYPNNITYIYKENGGQASARNLGLQYVKTDWLVFIDPDDFVSNGYFQKVDRLIQSYDLDFISLPMATYREEDRKFIYNKMPLSFCYSKQDQVFSVNEIQDKIQLSACNVVLRFNIIKNNNILFNELIKPNFEDGQFILDYFKFIENVCYSYGEYYYYRSREDDSSTSDTQWQKKKKFLDVFKYGFIPLLEDANKNKGEVPVNIQRTFLYFAMQYMREVIKNQNILNILTEDEKVKFTEYFIKSFEYIDSKEIMRFKLRGFNFYYKFGMIECIKKEKSPLLVLYIESLDFDVNEICLKYYSIDYFDDITVNIDGEEVLPVSIKAHKIQFTDSLFFYEKRIIVKFDNFSEVVGFNFKYSNYLINNNGDEFSNLLNLKQLRKKQYVNKYLPDKNIWLFMDKEDSADDNAEHLYRFMSQNVSDKKIYFGLKSDSPDWERLKKEGFNLLDYNSAEFTRIYKKAYMLLSSHADKYLLQYIGENSLVGKKFVFLQHGVTKDDISSWLNNVKKIDYVIAATEPEYCYFSGIDSPYRFYEKNTLLTGFPRHDGLYDKSLLNRCINNEILIMPTWRNSIVGAVKKGTDKRSFNNNFINSVFFKKWKSLLHHNKLKELALTYGYSIRLVAHPNLKMYLDAFEVPSYIKVDEGDKTYQEHFLDSKLLVTDYSSVAFDMAYINKPTVYYQFDHNEVFSGTHTYKKGYFDYLKDGFGPVAFDENEFFDYLNDALHNKCQVSDVYLQRIVNTFKYRDSLNSERVYKAICDSEKSRCDYNVNTNLLREYASSAIKLKHTSTALKRCEKLFLSGCLIQQKWSYIQLLELYYETNQFDKLSNLISQSGHIDSMATQRKIGCLQILKQDWNSSLSSYKAIDNKNIYDYCQIIKICAYIGNNILFEKYKQDLLSQDNSRYILSVISIYENVLYKKWAQVIVLVDNILNNFDWETVRPFKLQLLAAKACREVGDLGMSNMYLRSYEKHTNDDHECRIEIAYLAYINKNYKKVVSQLRKGFNDEIMYLPTDLRYIYFESLYKENMLEICDRYLNIFEKDFDLIYLKLFVLRMKGDWKNILSYAKNIKSRDDLRNHLFTLFLSYYESGDYEKALDLGRDIEEYIQKDDLFDYYQKFGDMSILNNDWYAADLALRKSLLHAKEKYRPDLMRKIMHVQYMSKVK